MNDSYWKDDEYENYSVDNLVKITYAESKHERVGDIGVIVGKVAKEGVVQTFSEYYVLTHYGVLKKASDCISDLGKKCTRIYRLLYV